MPQYPREGDIGVEMHLRVRHVVSGTWLHIDMPSSGDLTPAQKARGRARARGSSPEPEPEPEPEP